MSGVTRLADNAWALFRAEENVRQADIQDSTSMDKVRNYMMTYQRGRIEDWLLSEADSFVERAKVMGFDSAAMDMGIYKDSFGPLPLNYGNTSLFSSVASAGIYALYNEYSQINAGTDERFWLTAFTTPLLTPSAPVSVGGNVVVLYPLEESEDDEYNTSLIQMYYPYWLSNTVDTDIRSYFMNSGKLDDRFWDVFRYFL
jgi:hypothetical protein